jgi:peptide/nickel transport system substrate-binding protein
LAAFRSKQILFSLTPPQGGLTQEDIDRLKREIPGLGILLDKGYTGMHTFLQADITPTSDLRVRQAISKIIDRQTIIDAVQGRGFVSPGIILPEEDMLLPEAELKKLMARDVAGAKQLMQAAGVTGWNTNMGFYANPDAQTSAELVQANLKEIGIQTTLQPWDAVRLNRYWVEQNTEIVTSPRQTGGSPNADTVQYFKSTGDRNLAKIKDPEVDALIDAQFAELDKNKRKALLQQIQRKVLERAAPLTVYGGINTTVYHPFVKNFYAGGYGQGTLWEFLWLDQ